MALTKTERLTREIRNDLERHFAGRPARLRDALKSLLRLLLTAETPEPLDDLRSEIRGLQAHLKALLRHLRNETKLPQAVVARYEYKRSETQVKRRYHIKETEWRFVHDFAAEVGWPLDILVPLIDFEVFTWHDDLEREFVHAEVMLSEEALNDMLVCALEGYLSPRTSKRKGYEVYGVNLGMTRETFEQKKGRGLRVTRYVAVMRSQPQMSAEGFYDGVVPNDRSLAAVLSATTSLFPQYEAVADFHSHCYDDINELESRGGWRYSDGDERSNIVTFQETGDVLFRPSVTFIVGVAKSARRTPAGRFHGLKNVMQLSVGSCRFTVGAFRILGSGRYTKQNIRLSVAGMVE